MKSAKKAISLMAGAVLLAGAMAAAAQAPGARRMMRMYDPATETTFNGTVEETKAVPHGGMMAGMHLRVKVDDQVKEVMLGPSNFMITKGFTFAKGDSIEVTGSKVTMGGTEYIVAREVVKDGKTLTLRDKNGVPEWAGMRRRGAR